MAKLPDDVQIKKQGYEVQGLAHKTNAPTSFFENLATMTEDGVEVLKINQNLDNGDYVFTFEGKNYEVSMFELARSFLASIRKNPQGVTVLEKVKKFPRRK